MRLKQQLNSLPSTLLLTGAILTTAAPCYSQQTSEQRWFDIEVIVFKHKRGDSTEELWNKTESIQLPANLQDIVTSSLFPDPNQPPPASTDDNQSSDQRASGENQKPANQQTPIVFQQPTSNDANDQQTSSELMPLVPMTPELRLQQLMEQSAFKLLPDEQFQLADIASSMNRSSAYKLVSHFAWRQPVKNRADAEWVRVVGGQEFSGKFDYSGNDNSQEQIINDLGISINPFATSQPTAQNNGEQQNYANTAETTVNNQQMTSSEALTSSVECSDSNGVTDRQDTSVNPSPSNPSATSDENSEPTAASNACQAVAEQLPVYVPVPEIDGAVQIYLSRYLHINTQLYLRRVELTDLDISAISSSLSSSLLELTNDGVLNSSQSAGFNWNYNSENLFDSQQQERYQANKLINYSLSQSRRVRSSEVHYFDHPLFGLIVQITPYEFPNPDELEQPTDSSAQTTRRSTQR